jgi:hypothetical protein
MDPRGASEAGCPYGPGTQDSAEGGKALIEINERGYRQMADGNSFFRARII